MKRALSIDGGGIKGLVPARILERLLATCPELLAKVDLFAGTSTGGILALALAAGVQPDRCAQLYLDHGERIFASRGLLDDLTHVDVLVRANYSNAGLRAALEEVFGDMQLGDLSVDVLIPALDMRTLRPKFFDREHDAKRRCVDVALSTSAAPLYFQLHDGHADGGLFANCPADSALGFLAARGTALGDVRMLSIGCGASPYNPPDDLFGRPARNEDWGVKQWLAKKPHLLLAALFDGGIATSVFRAKAALGLERFHRIQPVLPREVGLDDVTSLPLLELVAAGHELDEATAWINERWN